MRLAASKASSGPMRSRSCTPGRATNSTARRFRRGGRNCPVLVIYAMVPPAHDLHKEVVMKLTIVLFDGFTALDVVGGYEVLARIPGVEVDFVAEATGVVAA